ncbi:MAG: dihydrodipicolinate synthase family protein [Rhodospirillaceae bacterium]|nr:MAG: dihydrodipicolinate synthase family protein [Rhodospirillaceae bacterium]
MARYSKGEARSWAREHLKGVSNVIHPSFSANLKSLNEQGIRHDVRLDETLGFTGALLISEVAISIPEYRQFFQIARDESSKNFHLVHHASWNTFEDNIEAVRIAEEEGADVVLLSYPSNFWPKGPEDIYDYTKRYCDATSLGVMLFPLPFWGFDRLHPSDIQADIIRRLIDDCPNIVAIKAEGAMPGIMGFVECYRKFNEDVVVTYPLESEFAALAQFMPMQYSGTSNTEYFGATFPKVFELLRDGNFDEATRIYWQLHPARKAAQANSAYLPHTLFIHRMMWKYMGWLQGFNGGPSRAPTMRLNQRQLTDLRQGLIRSGLEPTVDADAAFFEGRFPC